MLACVEHGLVMAAQPAHGVPIPVPNSDCQYPGLACYAFLGCHTAAQIHSQLYQPSRVKYDFSPSADRTFTIFCSVDH